jgi:tRNA pseudouridine55 synthase
VLGEDIGEALGCGAHLNALRRTQVGALTTEHMITLDALVAHAAPLTCCRRSMRCCPASRRAAECRAGQALPERPAPAAGQGAVDQVPQEQGRVRVYLDDKLLGTAILGEYSILAPERLIAFSQQ